MATAVSLARWLFSNASSGTAPTTIADDTGHGNTLTIDYSSGDASWTSNSGGNGLNYTAASATASGPRCYIANAVTTGNISSTLDGATGCSLLMGVNVTTPSTNSLLFWIGNGTSGGDFSVWLNSSRQLFVFWGDEYNGYQSAYFNAIGTGFRVIQLVIDTTQATLENRAALWDNGSTVALQASGIDFALNKTFAVTPGYPVSVHVGNRNPADMNMQGTIFYAELFTGQLTSGQASTAYTNLTANHDTDWAVGGPTGNIKFGMLTGLGL